ncbi:MAG: AAA family ATPase [Burkholderiales bacterium]|nr:AAA family ATPase [Burkholderiales bacterium]
MLREVLCSGFKSLEAFSITFKPGVNIIIGPNGGGKTNIILFLEFIGSLSHSQLMEAISTVGGAGKIFRRTLDGYIGERIEFTVKGSGAYYDYRRRDDKKYFSTYTYSASILLSTVENSVAFANQRLQVSVTEGDGNDLFGGADLSIVCDVESRLTGSSDVEPTIHILDHSAALGTRKGSAEGKHDEFREKIIQSIMDFGKSRSLFLILDRDVRGADFIRRDLAGARSFNISPQQVREPEDIATPPFIQPNGSGLAATLYELKNSVRPKSSLRYYFGVYRDFPDADRRLGEIISHVRIVNESIRSVSVEPDPIESKLRVFLFVSYEGGELKLPFGLVSDGTAKWLALVTAISTSFSLFAIEEPENFLHPTMQAEIVRILRNHQHSSDVEQFAIVTTHSETILNHANPDEIVVVSMENGRTIARRPSNQYELIEQIKKTGFGLGYFYLAGAIE